MVRYLIIIALIVLLYNILVINRMYDKFFTGIWKAAPEFCEKAGIDGMLLTIGDTHDFYKRSCYLIMFSDNKVIAERTFTMNMYSGLNSITPVLINNSCRAVGVYGDDIEDIFPQNMILTYDILANEMSLKDGEEYYGVFFKDAQATSIFNSIEV